MKKIIVVAVAVCFCQISSLLSKTYPAKVTIDLNDVQSAKLTNKTFGGFIEPLLNFVNDQLGIWAQEFYDRGFDLDSANLHVLTPDSNTTSSRWEIYRSGDSSRLKLVDGGYNENGLFAQSLKNYTDTSVCGVYQNILASDSLGYNFYIYTKGNDTDKCKLYLRLESDNGVDFYDKELELGRNEWKKVSLTTPYLKTKNHFKAYILLRGKGECQIDESSLMETNNVDGIRYEYYIMLKDWKMGILRYPGGVFADLRLAYFENGLGDIDKRKSPNYYNWFGQQRLDFGTIEYINFCKKLNIEPQITANYYSGTPEEAGNYVDFMNGDSTTEYGRKRIALGYPEPFSVKYWEIGNEQYGDHSGYAKGYIPFYNEMKKRDSSLIIICDGDKWADGYTFSVYDTLFNYMKHKCQIYGIHEGIYPDLWDGETGLDRYLRLMGYNFENQFYYDLIKEHMIEKGDYAETKLATTEWGVNFDTDDLRAYTLDTNYYSGSLNVGLTSASWYNTYMRYPELIQYTEKIFGIGCFKRGINKHTGRRSIYGNLAYVGVALLSNHFGENVVNTKVDVEAYQHAWYAFPWVDVTATYSQDSVYISLINKNPDDSVEVEFDMIKPFFGNYCINYQMYSDSYDDLVTAEEPHKIGIKETRQPFAEKMTFPPHSWNLIAMRFIDAGVDDETKKLEKFKVFNYNSKMIIMPLFDEPNSIVEIVDITGKIIAKSIFDFSAGNSIRYDLSGYRSGMYIVSVKNAKTNFYKKVIVAN